MEEDQATNQEKLEALRASNRKSVEEVRALGAQISPESLLHLRLNVFFDTFIPAKERLQYELNFETALGEMFAGVISQIRAARLTQGVGVQGVPVQPGTSLFIPGR